MHTWYEAPTSEATLLHLMDGPFVTVGGNRFEIPDGSRRLLVLVALGDGRVDRARAAGVLWPDVDDKRAAGNLRSALWRLNSVAMEIIVADKRWLQLGPNVSVDIRCVRDWAARIVSGAHCSTDLSLCPWLPCALDLLPGWYDDWAVLEREILRHRVLHALEALSRLLCDAGRLAEGGEAALMAVAAEPLRESAQRVLIQAHLDEGNLCEAYRSFERYRAQLMRDLGVAPSRRLQDLISGARIDIGEARISVVR